MIEDYKLNYYAARTAQLIFENAPLLSTKKTRLAWEQWNGGWFLRCFPLDLCRRYEMAPVCYEGSALTVAMVDPHATDNIADMELLTGYSIEAVINLKSADIRTLLDVMDEALHGP